MALSAPNPYEPPSAALAPRPSRIPPPLQLLVYSVLSLKAVQLVASIWLIGRGAAAYWSLLDVGLHLSAGALLLAGRRWALAPVALAAALGLLVSLRGGHIIPARALYLIGLPLVVVLLTLRHWNAVRTD